jgi:hypothetical protein
MRNGVASFPANWGACPPADADDANITVYRAVRTDPPSEIDFRSWLEKGKAVRGHDKTCQARGLSVLLNLKEAKHYIDAFPSEKCKFVASATLVPIHGKTKPTASAKFPSHVTWWAYPDVVRQDVFHVVDD